MVHQLDAADLNDAVDLGVCAGGLGIEYDLTHHEAELFIPIVASTRRC